MFHDEVDVGLTNLVCIVCKVYKVTVAQTKNFGAPLFSSDLVDLVELKTRLFARLLRVIEELL